MRKGILLIVVVMVLVGLSGCPLLGIGGETGNTLVVHNDKTATATWSGEINFLSVVKVSDECSTQRPEGVNLLPEPIKPGESFSVKGLADGRYYCKASFDDYGYVTLAGGNKTDWYVK